MPTTTQARQQPASLAAAIRYDNALACFRLLERLHENHGDRKHPDVDPQLRGKTKGRITVVKPSKRLFVETALDDVAERVRETIAMSHRKKKAEPAKPAPPTPPAPKPLSSEDMTRHVNKVVTINEVADDCDHVEFHPHKVTSIIKAASEHFCIPMCNLISHRRQREIARPRQIAVYLAMELTDCSMTQVGKLCGGRDHTTILYSWKLIGALLADDADPNLAADIAAVRALAIKADPRLGEGG